MIQTTTIKKIKTKSDLVTALNKTNVKELMVIENTESRLVASQVQKFLSGGPASIILVREK